MLDGKCSFIMFTHLTKMLVNMVISILFQSCLQTELQNGMQHFILSFSLRFLLFSSPLFLLRLRLISKPSVILVIRRTSDRSNENAIAILSNFSGNFFFFNCLISFALSHPNWNVWSKIHRSVVQYIIARSFWCEATPSDQPSFICLQPTL